MLVMLVVVGILASIASGAYTLFEWDIIVRRKTAIAFFVGCVVTTVSIMVTLQTLENRADANRRPFEVQGEVVSITTGYKLLVRGADGVVRVITPPPGWSKAGAKEIR